MTGGFVLRCAVLCIYNMYIQVHANKFVFIRHFRHCIWLNKQQCEKVPTITLNDIPLPHRPLTKSELNTKWSLLIFARTAVEIEMNNHCVHNLSRLF